MIRMCMCVCERESLYKFICFVFFKRFSKVWKTYCTGLFFILSHCFCSW